ncbi:hypothetical protein SGLAM104S_09396 [Streptomyces glaucescens]
MFTSEGILRREAPQARAVVLGNPRFARWNGSRSAGMSETERTTTDWGTARSAARLRHSSPHPLAEVGKEESP